MNLKLAEIYEKALEAMLLLLAFALPAAFYLKTYDAALVKSLTLFIGVPLAAAFAFLRAVELGRFEWPANRSRLLALAAALLAWTAISTLSQQRPEPSLFGAAAFAAPLVVFMLTLAGPASTGFAASLSAWTLAAAAVAGGYACFQTAGLDPAIWKGAFGAQAFSTLANPDSLGVFCGAVLPIAVLWSFDDGRGLASRTSAALAGMLAFAGVVEAGSLTGLIALSASGGAAAALALAASPHPPMRAAGLVSAFSIPLGWWGAWTLNDTALMNRLVEETAALSAIGSGAWKMLADHLWTGVGAGGFEAAFPPYGIAGYAAVVGRHSVEVSSAHSAPLTIACELGLIGFALWAAAILAVLTLSARGAARRARSGDGEAAFLMTGQGAAFAGLLAGGAFGVALDFPAPALLLWLLGGSLAGLALERGSATACAVPIPASPAARRILYAPPLLLLAAVAAGAAAVWRSDIDLNAGLYHAERGSWNRALERFAKVSPYAPAGLMARYAAGNLLQHRKGPGDLEAALAKYAEVTALAPDYLQVHHRRGAALLALGRWREAAESLERSAALDPGFPDTYLKLGEAATILGRKEEARRAALALVRIDPDEPAHWKRLAETYDDLGKPKVALRMLDRAEGVSALAGVR